MKILCISDTHGFNESVKIPDGIDMIIHSGDATNTKDAYNNEPEMRNFLNWYANVKVAHKIYVAGNHDTSVEKRLVTKNDFKKYGINYLEHESMEIDGIRIFGSPWTPNFGMGWAFNRDRAKMYKTWSQIPLNTDIVVTHGPPKGILDVSSNREGSMEYCGDISLLRHIQIIQPKYHIFGHIHDYEGHMNHGSRTIGDCYTTFINASLVEDGRFDRGLIHQGIEVVY